MSKFIESISNDVRVVIQEELAPLKKLLEELQLPHQPAIKLPGENTKEVEIVYLQEAADLLRKSKSTVIRLEKLGFFSRANRQPKSPIYYLKTDLDNFLLGRDN